MTEIIFSDGYGPFPNVEFADEDGLLAVGATLATDRLLHAYASGIFPWYNDTDPICWYSPSERFVLFPEEIKISKSMKSILNNHKYRISRNEAFKEVMTNCAKIFRPHQDGTWIHPEMISAYTELHQLGYAYSIEIWDSDELVGGLYGVEINNIFCGESMFSKKSNTSKLALIHLCNDYKYSLIDCQIHSEHLAKMGARKINRNEFLKIIKKTPK